MREAKCRNRCLLIVLALACLATGFPTSASAQRAVPVEVTREEPIAVSGNWSSAGLAIPSMIVHDIIFYVADDNGNSSCQFTMNFVIDNISSRTLRRFTLFEGGSVELHYEAGIDTANLRFGTIGWGCLRHYVFMGYPKP